MWIRQRIKNKRTFILIKTSNLIITNRMDNSTKSRYYIFSVIKKIIKMIYLR